MRQKQLQANTATEALIMEHARLLAQELEKTCSQAADGQVLDQAESVILKQGREFLRTALQASLQQQSRDVEKKQARLGPAPASDVAMTKDDAGAMF
jgi:hypothetical protein